MAHERCLRSVLVELEKLLWTCVGNADSEQEKGLWNNMNRRAGHDRALERMRDIWAAEWVRQTCAVRMDSVRQACTEKGSANALCTCRGRRWERVKMRDTWQGVQANARDTWQKVLESELSSWAQDWGRVHGDACVHLWVLVQESWALSPPSMATRQPASWPIQVLLLSSYSNTARTSSSAVDHYLRRCPVNCIHRLCIQTLYSPEMVS